MNTINVYFRKDGVSELFFEAEGYQSALYELKDRIFNEDSHRGREIVIEDEIGMNIMPIAIRVPLHEERYYLDQLGNDPYVAFDTEGHLGWLVQGNGNYGWYVTETIEDALMMYKEDYDDN